MSSINGKQLGKEIKEGLKGLNTVASPKRKSVCAKLMIFPFIAILLSMVGGITENDIIIELCLIPALLSGSYQFYIGKFKKGILYTFTIGGFLIGTLIDLFKLKVTGTLKDANGFPIIY